MYILFALFGLVAATCATAAPDRKPDIVVILSDDMGFSDLGCYGGEIRTPNLDRLAAEGVRFTQAYNCARCCPTRAALLTGLYPHQVGVGHMMGDRGLPGYRGRLSKEVPTLAEALKPAGYQCYMVGKWHVTPVERDPQGNYNRSNWPRARGFDRFYGTIHGAGSFFDPNTLVRDDDVISPYADPEYRPERFYYTDAISDHAVRFIAEHARQYPDRPFFLYIAYTSAHWPMHAKPEDIARYRGRYDAGYDAIRTQRWQRAIRMGLIREEWDLPPQRGGAWSDVKDRAFELRCMEVYAAMVDCMDQGIGRVVAALREHGRWDHAVVMYMQDNGACAEGLGRTQKAPPPQRPSAPTLPPMAPEAIQTDMIPKQTRDGYPVRQGYGVLPGDADTYIAYGEAWANVCNTPFREYKHWVHEGGIATPFIVAGPAAVPPTRHGTLEHQPVHVIDVFPTCLELAGLATAALPTPPEGVSLLPALQGRDWVRPTPLFFEHEGNRAVRSGKWKLVAKGPEGPWELYDMERDRTEMRDLAAQHPDVVRELSKAWDEWARRAHVLPWPWDRKPR